MYKQCNKCRQTYNDIDFSTICPHKSIYGNYCKYHDLFNCYLDHDVTKEDKTMNNDYAKTELTRAGLFDKDSDYAGEIGNAVMELIDVFTKQGHSGFSAPLVVRYFSKLALFKPLTAIMGSDDEWYEVDTDTWQNNRCSALFREGETGTPYYLDGIVWRTQDGVTFTGSVEGVSSRQFVYSFPFIPKTFMVDVIENADGNSTIKDREQLIPAFEYYGRKG